MLSVQIRVWISLSSSLNPHHCCCSIMSTWSSRGSIWRIDSSYPLISKESFTEHWYMMFLFTTNRYYYIIEPADRRTNPFFSINQSDIRMERDLRCSSEDLRNCTNWNKTVGFTDPNIFHRCLWEGKDKQARGMWSVQDVPVSLASVGFLCYQFWSWAVEGHAQQDTLWSCGLGNLLLANCELLRKTCTSTCNACFRMPCTGMLKTRK